MHPNIEMFKHSACNWSFCLKSLVYNYLTFQSFSYGRTWWCFFQKRVMPINFDIYVFYCNESSLLYIWNRSYVKVLLRVSVVNCAVILLIRPMFCICPSYDAGQMLILVWLYLDKTCLLNFTCAVSVFCICLHFPLLSND